MEQHQAILKQQEKKLAKKLLNEHQLVCKQLEFGDTAPLYIAKSHWSNRFDPSREKTIGIFFAIWVTPELMKQKKYAYNIHAKQLRDLQGYKLVSRKFAEQFREAVSERVADWPGIRLDYGPTTLLGGNDTCDLDNFGKKIEKRVAGLVSISDDIDDLLLAATV